MMSKAKVHLDLTKPVAVWSSQDALFGRPARSLTVILRTIGCSWKSCVMCGFASEGAPSTAQDLMDQFNFALNRLSPQDQIVKIYTSGSFLDNREIPMAAREQILEILQNRGIEKLVIESRPEYITPSAVENCLSRLNVEFAIGLETANDLIRQNIIKKGFTFQDFVAASEIVHQHGGSVKAYLLLKPPFLSEGLSIRDALASCSAALPYADLLSLNLCNVQHGTLVERLWERGEFRPPWLWSAVEVLKHAKGPIICDPVGAGKRRGPHNCGACDAAVEEAIRSFSLSQDRVMLNRPECECQSVWQKVMELEESSFGVPLF